MKTLKIFLLSILFISYSSLKKEPNTIILGNTSSNLTWIYLCGLTQDFDSSFEKDNRFLLDEIGKNINIKIIAIKPKNRCPEFNNMLCWPHNNKQEVLETYKRLEKTIIDKNVNGYIGFSNGGFFLLKLAEINNLNIPIIVIGAGGYIGKIEAKNKIFLLIGKQDKYHYDLAKQLYQQSQGTSLDVTLIEYDQGHVIPKQLLQQTIQNTSVAISK